MVLLKRKDMKKLITTLTLALLLAGAGTLRAEDWPDEYLGLPGDNLNLYAVMDLFQKSETIEGFERSLNDENSRINNLDLNGDNLVDYIMVSDYADGDVHNVVLRVALNERENQDVAVFIVEKLSDGSVRIQLIGDEALYGKNYIIEPNYAETPNPGYMGNYARPAVTVVTSTYWDIARWPVVVYIYRPGYIAWHSAWYWGYWPSWWYGWSPYYWHYYYGYHYHWFPHYYAYYHHWDHYRGHWYHDYYYNRVRVYSPTVVVNVHKNYYRNTYSRPDLRKDGEAQGARAYNERGSRSDGMQTNVSRDDRRNVNQSTGNQGRMTTGTSTTERRTTGTVNNGSRTYSSTGRSNGTTSRSTSNGTYKSDRSSSGSSTIETTRSTTGTIKNSSGTNSSAGRTTGTTNRPTTTVNKSTGNSSSGRTYGTTSRPTTSSSYKSSGSSSTVRNSGSVNRSTTSSRSSGSVSRSSSSGSNKSVGKSSSGRSSSSGSRSSSSKGSSSSSHARR